jgi:hypothetical protein
MRVFQPTTARKFASLASAQPETCRPPCLGVGALDCQFRTSERALSWQNTCIRCSAGRPHNANVASVEPLVTTFPDGIRFEEDADGEVVQDYFDRRSLERLYTQSPSEGDVPGLEVLLEQVERLGREANTALSEALEIPGLLEQAEHLTQAFKSHATSRCRQPLSPAAEPSFRKCD